MDFEIRELLPSDLSRGFLEALANLAEVGLSPTQAEEVLRERQRSGIRTYVAWDPAAKEIVGTVTVIVERKFIHRGGKVGHIEDVAVRRGFRGKGLGAELVRHATSEARRLGCYKVILNCFDQLAPFYSSLGYRRHDIGMRIDLGVQNELRR
jgi:glucosamine-phosphate N-acetyltransferase